jgi:hypothetical protein
MNCKLVKIHRICDLPKDVINIPSKQIIDQDKYRANYEGPASSKRIEIKSISAKRKHKKLNIG